MNESLTTLMAGSAVTAPLWLTHLTELSEISAILLALTGALWFCTQTWAKIKEDRRKEKEFKINYEDKE